MVTAKPVSKNAKSTNASKKDIRKKKVHLKFNIECKNPAEDRIIKTDDFDFFPQRVELNKTKVSIITDVPFSKRYLKYLTKKHLKKIYLRDWLRIVAINKNTYEVRYFHINWDGDEGSDNE
ncbi:unnamed protein product [Nippostrongylus brasiliensis]|uniref:Large ribosomal subunit protein eL22 n=1 Tax=Nippostrongylus brasiliensis TaxID=27835 RepID=A0A0N4Y0E8_NIPBR|nr:hypothetical protein Q1695_001098 [Nippostrongylus brasiliensis]VDL72584.1 unnamed protein product [Nippostrongylus brasiliensis]